jgi:glucose/arabinose dehydrogenase
VYRNLGLLGVIGIVAIGPLAGCRYLAGEPQAEPAAVIEEAAPVEGEAAQPVEQSQPSPEELPLPGDAPTPPPAAKPNLDAIQLELRAVVDDLDRPVGLANAGDGSGRLFVVLKDGIINEVRGDGVAPTPFLDIRDRVNPGSFEQGLLGLAFHPKFASNGFFYVNYTDDNGDTVVSRFSVSASDPSMADPDSEALILAQDQPAGNHNGGHLVFGPDGYLYIGLGDGGAANDQFRNGQNGQTFLGAMLRLDVDGGAPYAIPADNPFVGNADVRDEIWAIGLRNPWRYSFDRVTGDLYIADVGQGDYEEISVQPAASPGGENYGWPLTEGLHCFRNDGCDSTGLTLPVAEYDHGRGCSVTGGHVYRGQSFPALSGVYLFGDFCSGRIWGLAPGEDGGWQMAELVHTDIEISSFGEDERGEVFVLDISDGVLYQIAAR